MARDSRKVADLKLFGGESAFPCPKSIGSLAQPPFERFMAHSRAFFEERRYANGGPCARQLESKLAEFHHTSRCVAFSSASSGLALAMRCLALPGRSEVVMPSLTDRRIAEVAALVGLVPRFCDVDSATLGQSAETVARCLNGETALILGVHPSVNCCDALGLEHLSETSGIPLLFDSVESPYESCHERKVGSFGHAECFSLRAGHLINGFEGGYITTDDTTLADRLSCMRAFGFVLEDLVVELGMNAKLNEIHAAMALASLEDLDALVERNRARYETYRDRLAPIPGIALRRYDERARSSFKDVLVELQEPWPFTRGQTLEMLHAEGILAWPYCWPPLHAREAAFEQRFASLPVTDSAAERFLLLPCGEQVNSEDILVIVALLAFIAENAEAIRACLAKHSLVARA